MRQIAIALLVVLVGVNGLHGQRVNKEDIPKYMKQLKSSSDPAERAFAAAQIAKRGAISIRDVKDAIPLLKNALKNDKAEGVRAASARALGTIGYNAKETVPVLVESLKDKSLTVNLAAIRALTAFGAQAKSAIPAMRKFMRDKSDDKKIRRTVALAIKMITASSK